MVHPLADRGTPRALAEGRQIIDYKGNLSDFERLSDLVEAELRTLEAADRPAQWRQTPVCVGLTFGFADLGEAVPVVTGRATATVDAVCQRCLEACKLDLDVRFNYLLVESGGQHVQREGYEVWELTESTLRPLDLVEEALIMTLPMTVAHSSADLCGPLAARLEVTTPEKGDTVRPFADLRAQLKGTD